MMAPRGYQTLIVTEGSGVVTVTLNRPDRRNALSAAMVNELLYVIGDANGDPDTRVIVLQGAGPVFCAGGDFSQMSGAEDGALALRGDFADLLLAMMRTTRPIVARVHGHAMGGGLGLVAAATYAFAASEAQLGTPEVHVGIFPMMIMAVLARLVPRRRLTEMMLSGERMNADHAASIGLINRAVPAADLDATVAATVQMLVARSPAAIRLGLDAFVAQDDLALAEALPMLRERLAGVLTTDDAREGLTAFLEKRKPVWTGK